MVIVRIYCYSPKIVATDLNTASKGQQKDTAAENKTYGSLI
jgi:hypothetical protein